LFMAPHFLASCGRKALDVLATPAPGLVDEMLYEVAENRRCASKAAAKSLGCFQMPQRRIPDVPGLFPPMIVRANSWPTRCAENDPARWRMAGAWLKRPGLVNGGEPVFASRQ